MLNKLIMLFAVYLLIGIYGWEVLAYVAGALAFLATKYALNTKGKK